jgi:hypothetical protein
MPSCSQTECFATFGQVGVFLGVLGEFQRSGLTLCRLGGAAGPCQQFRARHPVGLVAGQVESVDRGQRRSWPVELRDGDGAVQGDYGCRGDLQPLVVQRPYLPPVGVLGTRRVGVTALIAAWNWYGPGKLPRRQRRTNS